MTVDELLNSKGISYRPGGKDLLIRCLNPDHDDKNPSLRVDKTTGIFNCFSCGFSGSIFEHFGEKANWLQIRRDRVKSIIADKLHEATGHNIPANAVPFDQDWRGISRDTYRKFEAFQHSNPEFIGRVVFPVRNISHKIIGFCGRHQGDGVPKYLFHPAKIKLPLFPIVKPIQGSIILVEGIMDMINLHDKGLTNAICMFGVNSFTEDKLNLLKIQGISAIYTFMDNDEAGQNGADKIRKLVEDNELEIQNITMQNVKDPGELTASKVIKLKEKLYGA